MLYMEKWLKSQNWIITIHILLMSLFVGLLVLKMHYKVVMALAQTNLYLEKVLICHVINLPPAMEDVSHADILVKHLNELHAARKAFIKAESNKLRCALKAKNWETTGIEYKIGDMLYYKR